MQGPPHRTAHDRYGDIRAEAWREPDRYCSGLGGHQMKRKIHVWASVVGYPNYEVSNAGSVRRVTGQTAGKVLHRSKCTGGYLQVSLCCEGVQTTRRVHQLVLEAFGPTKPTEVHEVNHKNSVRDDSRIENLEWVTRSENILHGYRSGNIKPTRGELSGSAKLTTDQVREIRRRVAGGETQVSVASLFGVAQPTVSQIVSRQRWKYA